MSNVTFAENLGHLQRDVVIGLHELFTAFIRQHYCGKCDVCLKLARIAEELGFHAPKAETPEETYDTY